MMFSEENTFPLWNSRVADTTGLPEDFAVLNDVFSTWPLIVHILFDKLFVNYKRQNIYFIFIFCISQQLHKSSEKSAER